MKTDSKLIRYSWLWFFALLLVFFFMFGFGHYYQTETKDILNLEFAKTFEAFKTYAIGTQMSIEEQWIPSLYFDFGFIVCYTILFILSIKIFQYTLRLNKIPIWIYLLCLTPGILDVAENLFMLSYFSDLYTTQDNSAFTWYKWVVRFKWASVIPFSIMALTIALFYVSKIIGYVINKIIA